jgi:hypothetical protein
VQLYTLFARFFNNRVALFLLSDWAVPTARKSIALFYAYSAIDEHMESEARCEMRDARCSD